MGNDHPERLLRRVLHGVSKLAQGDLSQIDILTELYAEQTHVSHPLLPGYPVLTSRSDLRRHFAETPSRIGGMRFQAEDIQIHATTDPEVIVAEFTYRGSGPAGPLAAHCIFVWRTHAGQIVEARDYIDYGAFARAARASDG
jgi:uncharacterized protein